MDTAKYTAIRNRFFDEFYFEGRIAESLSSDGKSIKFADQTIYMGQALLAFSAEARSDLTFSDPTPEACVWELLNGIETLEERSEERYGKRIKGLFVRDDISGVSDPRLKSKFAIVESDWQEPYAENTSPSEDQLLGLFFGLVAVVRWVSNESFVAKAREIAERLFDYARLTHFILRLPNGRELVAEATQEACLRSSMAFKSR